MPFDLLLGRFATLELRRSPTPGTYFATEKGNARDVIPLLGSEIPTGAKEGDEIKAFVHLDSAGRPIATTRIPKLELGEVAFLSVTACTAIGAFVNWGLPKELLVPFAEQTTDMKVGERYAIGLYVDDTGRLAGTMRVTEMLAKSDPTLEWTLDEWVDGEAWRNDPDIGLFVIVERVFVGLVPKSEPHALSRGSAGRFRISNVLPDGKIELSLRAHAHEELAGDGRRILEVLSRHDGPPIGNKSTPDHIRATCGLSKKAFKRAAGRLLKERAISVDDRGFFAKTR
jgi:predicted RNA-binding protein (virulence factor B family)